MRLYIWLAVLFLLLTPAVAFAAENPRPNFVLGAETGIPPRDEFARVDRSTLTRVVRETQHQGIDVVVLEEPAEDDGYGYISVDKATELGRELARLCPDGTRCTIDAIVTNGTLTRIFNIQRAR